MIFYIYEAYTKYSWWWTFSSETKPALASTGICFGFFSSLIHPLRESQRHRLQVLGICHQISNIISDLSSFPSLSIQVICYFPNVNQIYSKCSLENILRRLGFTSLQQSADVNPHSLQEWLHGLSCDNIYYSSSPCIPLICHVANTTVLLIYTF